jgi:glycosyltransferase involved in cell wall biosynthesis
MPRGWWRWSSADNTGVAFREAAVRVMALPAFCNRKINPYNALLYSAVARVGAVVVEVSPRNVLCRRHDVVHVHWPEYFFDAPGLGRALAKSAATVLVLSALRFCNVRLVWTIHNLRGHEQWHPRLSAKMWRWFVRRVDGYIALTPTGRDEAIKRYPELCGRPSFVIPHGHYRDEYPDCMSREAARTALGLPPDAPVVGFFGTIRPYKNVPAMVAAFRQVPDADWRLVVAGKPVMPEIKTEIEQAAKNDRRIRVDLDFVPPERVQVYLRAADLIVFPYLDILNSGSAMLALSFDRPILVPERGAMAELRETVGAEWVQTYRGDLRPDLLIEAMAWATTAPRDADRLFRQLDWDAIGRQTLLAYQSVTATRRAGSPLRQANVG